MYPKFLQYSINFFQNFRNIFMLNFMKFDFDIAQLFTDFFIYLFFVYLSNFFFSYNIYH